MEAALAFLVALAATLALTPLAVRLARRTGFYDHPEGYKGHDEPTPYLGGIAVICGMLLAAALFGRGYVHLAPIAIGAVVLLGVGTIDDRYSLTPLTRLAIEVGATGVLFAGGVEWRLFGSDLVNFAVTAIFVVGVVNAFNLMDNMDGASGSVAAVSGAGLGTFALAQGSPALAAIAFALCGACLGFLRYNLASPARIFLGDGGSMPVGFVVAALIMAMPGARHLGWAFVPVAVVLVGLPALDTTLVVVSRLRRGAGVFTGGRDHLTHRLRGKLGTPRRVAAVLALAQALLVGIGALLAGSDDPGAAAFVAMLPIVAGIAVVARLESPEWAPAPAPEPAAEWST
jgi:UDP-GlcNAc:undecaprenyl-phosphate/decaprenyl-phosphate GlcNAc-1-phosphate transferase